MLLSSLHIFTLTHKFWVNQDFVSICRNVHGSQYLSGFIMWMLPGQALLCLCGSVYTNETSKHYIICCTDSCFWAYHRMPHGCAYLCVCVGVCVHLCYAFTIIHLMLSSVIRAELSCVQHAETQPQSEWSICTVFTYLQLWPWASFGDLNYLTV